MTTDPPNPSLSDAQVEQLLRRGVVEPIDDDDPAARHCQPFAAPPTTAQTAAVALINHTLGGDTAGMQTIVEAVGESWGGDFIHACLRLCRALAVRLRTPDGMHAIWAALIEVENADPSQYRRLGANLVLAHAQCADAWEIDSSIGLDTTVLYNVGVEEFNRVVCAADDAGAFWAVFGDAVALWCQLLPEVRGATGLVESVAAKMWADQKEGNP